ncbi:MAG TPA: M67 family metallopeptidase [Solirubrobacterales bacterium]|jgi:proteasome lid subunit RPN8/RPN11|nr:M67 family metallopeptidase [Solirubrobacterales bacterium]
MKITQSVYDGLVEHAREEAPNECCGILGGNDGEATTLYRATNAEHSPLRYTLDPNDLFRITFREIPDNDEEMLAIYHSHTASPAYPSQTDINLATYPDSIYLILSLAEGEEPLRGFRIDDGQVSEVELTVG